MTAEELVKGIQEELIERGSSSYRAMYENPRAPSEAIAFFQSLSDQQKEVFFGILKQTRIDTVAAFLALLDGNLLFKNQEEDLRLIAEGGKGEILNGDLTDMFLRLNYQWKR